MTSNSTTLSLTVLRRYHFGELPPEEAARVKAGLESDAEARARLARIEAEEAAFLGRVDVAAESVAILERLDAPPPRRSPAALLARLLSHRGLQLAAAMVLLVALVPIGSTMLGPSRGPNRTKGSVALEMFVKDEGGIRRGEDGVRLKAGDQIQFRYQALGHRYVFVVSIDGSGAISPLYPDRRGESIPVRPDGRHTLDGSIILDDAVGPERIFALFSDEPLPFEAIEAGLRGERDLTALQRVRLKRQDVDQASVLIIKE